MSHAKMMHKGQGIPGASHRDNYFIRVVQTIKKPVSSDNLLEGTKKGQQFFGGNKKRQQFLPLVVKVKNIKLSTG